MKIVKSVYFIIFSSIVLLNCDTTKINQKLKNGSNLTHSCQQDDKIDESDLLELKNSIITQIGKAQCADVSSCKTIGFGYKECGGFDDYLIYSVENTDVEKLTGLVKKYNSMDEKYSLSHSLVSDCAITCEPGVDCISNQCVNTENRR